MKITWVTRSFLDYRVPVYKALDELCGNNLTLIYNKNAVPQRCREKIGKILGARAIPMEGEFRIGKKYALGVANKGIRIPIQKGLLKEIKKSKPDVLVTDGFFQWTYAALILKMFGWKGVKHVMCYEKTRHTERNAPAWRSKYRRFVSRWIDVIDCNGSQTEDYIHNVLGLKMPVTYGHMAADTEGMSRNVEMATDENVTHLKKQMGCSGLTFIYVGRLIPLKGIMEMLRAWKKAALDDATLMLVGEGDQRAEIEKYIADNKLENVKLAGAVVYDNLGPYYKAADCFIIPTLEDNWSLVVPEAMASGLPIACSIYNGCHPELVHPENGWTFDPLDMESMAGVLREIDSNRSNLQSMGEASKRIVANHTPKHATQGIYDACLIALGRK